MKMMEAVRKIKIMAKVVAQASPAVVKHPTRKRSMLEGMPIGKGS